MLLDTCAVLWLSEGGRKLSKEARERIEAAAVVYVSSITAFEIAVKYRAGKLSLPMSPMDWFEAVVAHHALAVTPLDWDVCIAATELPPIHRDPCDRFVIATAKMLQVPVVTADPIFGSYGIEVLS